ncbi:protein kinase [Orrella sp. NBD-18]|uniref:Protein kinase n=1 Tax=Sheuella amnicola TaxID=2707330 RepID=A0A6B2QZ05_9BURK|nr:serine/threonine-protein kinase [Sheuella amnicola]NDY83730.1 protein kinase [Sheuella amnicola]
MSKASDIPAVDEAFQAGKVIDGFVLGEEVHRGGMAVLISATKEGIDLPILLKIPRVGRNQPVESLIGFETELNIMSVLDSPDVPKFLGGGTIATHPYIAMERVAGTSLEELGEQVGRFPISEVIRIGATLAQAVQSLHAQDVIHLDLKPENILLDASGKLTLIDFGLAHHAHFPDLLAEEMRKGVGSAPYVSPEQIMGVREDSRSDIFSIGVILYEMLTDELPFGNPQSMGGLRRRLWAQPTAPRALRPDTPPWLQEVVLRCLEARAVDRYQSASRLRQCLLEPESVKLTERAERLKSLGFLNSVKRWWRAAGYVPSSCPAPSVEQDATPLIIAAIDTRQSDARLRERMLSAASLLMQVDPESRLICLSTIPGTPAIDGQQEAQSASGIVRGHLVQLMKWAEPLKLPPERFSCHVLEAMDPAARIVEFAQDNAASLILIGASRQVPNKVVPWRTSMTKIVEEAPCSVHIVRS